MQPQRKRLADILPLDERESIKSSFGATEAAADFAPVPKGEYVCRVLSGELFNGRQKGTAGYKLTFEITEGDYVGGRFWCDLWLTSAAMPMTKRDLAKLGVKSIDQLEAPLPPGILAKVKVVLRKNDDGDEHNAVRSFEVIGIEKGDAFAPKDNTTASKEGEKAVGVATPILPASRDLFGNTNGQFDAVERIK